MKSQSRIRIKLQAKSTIWAKVLDKSAIRCTIRSANQCKTFARSKFRKLSDEIWQSKKLFTRSNNNYMKSCWIKYWLFYELILGKYKLSPISDISSIYFLFKHVSHCQTTKRSKIPARICRYVWARGMYFAIYVFSIFAQVNITNPILQVDWSNLTY